MPRLAAAQMSILAPRAMSGAGLFGIHLLKHAEAALLPAGPGIEIRTVGEQEIEQLEIRPGDMHGRALEAEQRLVDARDQITVGAEQLPHLIDITHFNRRRARCRMLGTERHDARGRADDRPPEPEYSRRARSGDRPDPDAGGPQL